MHKLLQPIEQESNFPSMHHWAQIHGAEEWPSPAGVQDLFIYILHFNKCIQWSWTAGINSDLEINPINFPFFLFRLKTDKKINLDVSFINFLHKWSVLNTSYCIVTCIVLNCRHVAQWTQIERNPSACPCSVVTTSIKSESFCGRRTCSCLHKLLHFLHLYLHFCDDKKNQINSKNFINFFFFICVAIDKTNRV